MSGGVFRSQFDAQMRSAQAHCDSRRDAWSPEARAAAAEARKKGGHLNYQHEQTGGKATMWGGLRGYSNTGGGSRWATSPEAAHERLTSEGYKRVDKRK